MRPRADGTAGSQVPAACSEPRVVAIPDFCMVALVGVTSSGKSTFARTHFRASEVLSADACRTMITDDLPAAGTAAGSAARWWPGRTMATGERTPGGIRSDALDVLHFILRKRLARRRLTVVDATNRRREDRQRLLAIAREYRTPAVALLFDLPDDLLAARYVERKHRYVPRSAVEHALLRHVAPMMIRDQKRALGSAARGLLAEGFDAEYRFTSAAVVAAVRIQRQSDDTAPEGAPSQVPH